MTGGLHPLIRGVLARRGVTEPQDIEEFLSEKPKRTYDPFLLLNMEAGVDFVLSAVKRRRRICVYGDYDADGVASAALLVQVLRLLTDAVTWYIPSRFEEGYGLNKEALKNIAESGGQTVVTVDCGSVSPEEVAFGKELGLEILVTDHHNMAGRAPDCLILNPKQAGESYPFSGLAGCGVAFKLAQALQRRLGFPKQVLNELLDLLGIATIADIVPLVDENRTMAKYGLRALNAATRPGLRALIARTGLGEREIKAGDVAFILAPHINAAGRMGEAAEVVDLFLTDDEAKIRRVTEALADQNARRKRIQEEVFALCTRMAEAEFGGAPILVINAGGAHEGITGIVAGKLKDRFGKPAIVLTDSLGADGRPYLKGTGRSVPGLDLHALLKKYEGLFEKFGGHAMACGFLMGAEQEESLRGGLLSDVREMLSANPLLLDDTLIPDASLKPSEIDFALTDQLKRLAPFGSGNPAPIFALHGVRPKNLAFMGDLGQHVRFSADGLACVLFREAAGYAEALESGRGLSLLGSPSSDVWNGRERIQFIVRKILAE
jgi:single-stranded-DNA-specific exonuclease